ncbi:MAG TPA: Slp family lipoprotein [Arenimonas sp.]|uniref:Slp family lipoprotein n=1 Tax=Arenimonas sp. TaxID=1872635 RepID=UPI002BD4E052|nr:Slp family lipoprotein [Arenimonas sp.]HMB57773.1 Slp family lipoprotein [Arenimonas sp.]
MKRRFALPFLLTLAGCVSMPAPLQGQFSPLLPDDAAKREAVGELVRWGGQIVKVEPQATRSCFEIVGMALDSSGEPRKLDRSEGRFLACRTGFYDPEVFKPGRAVTITGRIEGVETRKVGDFDYRYARVAADAVYLWPVRKDVDVIVERVPFYW